MIESGIYNFYDGIADKTVKRSIVSTWEDDDHYDELLGLTGEQMKRPMIMVLIFFGVAIIIFILEIILFKFNIWRAQNRRQ